MAKEREAEAEVTLMRRVGPEKFEVVVGTIRGPIFVTKILERAVSLAVGRDTARRSLRRQHVAAASKLGLTVDES